MRPNARRYRLLSESTVSLGYALALMLLLLDMGRLKDILYGFVVGLGLVELTLSTSTLIL